MDKNLKRDLSDKVVVKEIDKGFKRPVEPPVKDISIPKVPNASHKNPGRDIKKMEDDLKKNKIKHLIISDDEENKND